MTKNQPENQIMNPELQYLVEDITLMARGINDNDLLIKKHSKISLDYAIRTGGLLVKTQSIVTEKWKDWCKDTFSNAFSVETAYRWMKLFVSVTSDTHIFDDCESINQAYEKLERLKQPNTVDLARGDIGEMLKNKLGSDNNPKEDNTSHLDSMVKRKVNSILKLFKKYGVKQFREDYKDVIELLKPLVDIYQPPVEPEELTFDNWDETMEARKKDNSSQELNKVAMKGWKQKGKEIESEAKKTVEKAITE